MDAEPSVKRRCVICHASYTRGEAFCSLDGGAIVAEGADDELLGKTIDGRYLISRLLGRGGMGKVYEAEHVGLGKRVAIKFVSDADADREQRARFRQEARAASKIVHEHVVQIFDVGVDGAGRDFIVMEYVEGRDLDSLLREGWFSAARAIAITQQILRGLHAVHAAGIIHRDIKPANIRLTDSADSVKIMDFGIAKSIHGQVAQTDTGTGRVIGTPQFMAPEQVLDGVVDHRADLYAVGATLYAMLAGAPPFGSTSFTQRIEALTSPAPSIDTVRSGLPASLVAAVARALQRSPDDRFSDALAFADALRDGAAVVDARMDASTKPIVYPGQRVAAAMAPTERSDTRSATGSRSEPAPHRRWIVLAFALALLAVAGAVAVAVIVVVTRREPPPPHQAVAAVTTTDASIAATVDAAIAPVATSVPVDAPSAAPRARQRSAPPPDAAVVPTGPPCDCVVTTKTGSISSACRQKRPAPMCTCESSNHSLLCPYVKLVTDNGKKRLPDGTRNGTMYCVDRTRPECDPTTPDMPDSCRASTTVAAHKAPCRGYLTGQVESDTPTEGAYRCTICNWATTAPKYRGRTGEACTGFESTTGDTLTGVMDCHEPK